MKRLIIILFAGLLAIPAFTQELSKKEQKQLEKQLKKEQKAGELDEKSRLVTAMVENQQFVLEAYMLKDKYGNTVNVSSTINFIAADSLDGVIQVGSNTYFGANGVGGETVEGNISNYKYTQHGKSGSYNVTYYLSTPLGSYDVRMTAYPDGRADADVRSTTWGGKLSYSGYLIPPGASRVYKGMSL
jgi:hypothetical protein